MSRRFTAEAAFRVSLLHQSDGGSLIATGINRCTECGHPFPCRTVQTLNGWDKAALREKPYAVTDGRGRPVR